ncbi:MAG: hypothetical protein AAF730_04925 [Bacteroidota bacterium]
MTLSIDLPIQTDIDEAFARQGLVAMLDATGKLSGKEAREVLGLSRRAFEAMLPRYGYAVLLDSQANIAVERAV